MRLRLGNLDDRRVEQRMASQQSSLGKPDRRSQCLDGQQPGRGHRLEPVGRATRDQQVVARPVGEGAVLGRQPPFTLVHEVEDITIGVAEEPAHPGRRPGPPPDAHVVVDEQGGGHPVAAAIHPAGVERGRSQRPGDGGPRRGWVQPVEVAGRGGEAFPAVLLLDRSRRQVGVGLTGGAALHPLRRYG